MKLHIITEFCSFYFTGRANLLIKKSDEYIDNYIENFPSKQV